jgi:hypothetical protein
MAYFQLGATGSSSVLRTAAGVTNTTGAAGTLAAGDDNNILIVNDSTTTMTYRLQVASGTAEDFTIDGKDFRIHEDVGAGAVVITQVTSTHATSAHVGGRLYIHLENSSEANPEVPTENTDIPEST